MAGSNAGRAWARSIYISKLLAIRGDPGRSGAIRGRSLFVQCKLAIMYEKGKVKHEIALNNNEQI